MLDYLATGAEHAHAAAILQGLDGNALALAGGRVEQSDVRNVDRGFTLDHAAGDLILAAAAAAGVTLPSSCGVGLCGSCKVTKTSGDVVMNHQGGIHRREIEQGKILLCCAEPLSPVVIDF